MSLISHIFLFSFFFLILRDPGPSFRGHFLQDAVLCGQKIHLSWGRAADVPPTALPAIAPPHGWHARPWEAAGVHQV